MFRLRTTTDRTRSRTRQDNRRSARLLQVGIARVCERHADWTDVAAHIFAHSLQTGGEYKLRVLAEVMTRNTNKVELDDDSVLHWRQFHPHRFIDDPAIAFIKSQCLADSSCSGGYVEQQSRLAQIGLLGQMQPEGAIA